MSGSDRRPGAPDSFPPGPAVRFATESDLPRIKALMRAAFAEYAMALGYAPSPMGRDFAPWVKERMLLTIGGPGQPLVAAAAVRPRPCPAGGYLYVDAIAVAPRRRRVGEGRRLMASIEAFAGALCFSRVRLHTSPILPAPMRFYQAIGYREIRRDGDGPDARVLFDKPTPSALDRLLDVAADR